MTESTATLTTGVDSDTAGGHEPGSFRETLGCRPPPLCGEPEPLRRRAGRPSGARPRPVLQLRAGANADRVGTVESSVAPHAGARRARGVVSADDEAVRRCRRRLRGVGSLASSSARVASRVGVRPAGRAPRPGPRHRRVDVPRGVPSGPRWQEDVLVTPGFRVALNISAVELGDGQFVARRGPGHRRMPGWTPAAWCSSCRGRG